jgi:hypothetical protein
MARTATPKLKINGSWDQFTAPLRDLTPFTTHGQLSGTRDRVWSIGRLPAEFRAAATDPTVDYVVMSYGTPIAWHDSVKGWTMPDTRYSVTTSKSQGRIRTALDALGALD